MSNSTSTSSPSPAARNSGEASGKRTGLHQPSNDKVIEDKLENVDLVSRGATVHDHLRDKRGKGVAGDYDDSIKHNADTHYAPEETAQRPEE